MVRWVDGVKGKGSLPVKAAAGFARKRITFPY